MELIVCTICWGVLIWISYIVKKVWLLVLIYLVVNIAFFFLLFFVFTLSHAPVIYIGGVPGTIEELVIIAEMLIIDFFIGTKAGGLYNNGKGDC